MSMRALLHDRLFVLADLIALRQIRIEVVLAREHRTLRYGGADGETELGRHSHGLPIQHRQHTGIAQVHQVCLRIGRSAIGSRGAREDLGLRRELRVNFKADDGFERHG